MRWFGRKRPEHPSLVVRFLPNHFEVTADWPDVSGWHPDDAKELARDMAAGAFFLLRGTGEGLSMVQAAIGRAAVTPEEKGFAGEVLAMLNRGLVADTNKSEKRPVVRAKEAFPGGSA